MENLGETSGDCFSLYEEDIKLILEYLPREVSDHMRSIQYRYFSNSLKCLGYNVKHLLKLARISSYRLHQE